MKIPLSWLKEFINTSLSSEELSDILTNAGLEVDAVEKRASDSIFDISLTPNLIHTASVFGVARELSALLNLPLKETKTSIETDPSIQTKDAIEVIVSGKFSDNKDLCPRYALRLIRDVKVGPSPQWLKDKIEKCGMRSINNIVDATNYALLCFGHPLHAFDYDLIEGKKIFVEEVQKEHDKCVTLDGVERALKPSMLVIKDTKKIIAIAGVMGAKSSEVSENTTNVLLECAYFHPSSIRKTSKELGLSTESSKHFERGVDPNQVLLSLDFAASLIQQIADGKVTFDLLDIKTSDFHPKTITCRLKKINEFF